MFSVVNIPEEHGENIDSDFRRRSAEGRDCQSSYLYLRLYTFVPKPGSSSDTSP